jgi:hypothetical protein
MLHLHTDTKDNRSFFGQKYGRKLSGRHWDFKWWWFPVEHWRPEVLFTRILGDTEWRLTAKLRTMCHCTGLIPKARDQSQDNQCWICDTQRCAQHSLWALRLSPASYHFTVVFYHQSLVQCPHLGPHYQGAHSYPTPIIIPSMLHIHLSSGSSEDEIPRDTISQQCYLHSTNAPYLHICHQRLVQEALMWSHYPRTQHHSTPISSSYGDHSYWNTTPCNPVHRYRHREKRLPLPSVQSSTLKEGETRSSGAVRTYTHIYQTIW